MYLSLVQSIADYSLPAYAPYVHRDALNRIRNVETEAAMIVGGTVARTRLTAIYGEANVLPIERRTELLSAKFYERVLRLPDDNPARRVALQPPPVPAGGCAMRAKRSWRKVALEVTDAAGLAKTVRDPTPVCAAEPPWRTAGRAAPPTFVCELDGNVTRKDPAEKRKEAFHRTLASLPGAAVEAFSDGSVLQPEICKSGGGGFYLTDAAGRAHRRRCPAGGLCNSMRAEMHAILLVLTTLLRNSDQTPEEEGAVRMPRGAEVRIATDSQSALRALLTGPGLQRCRLGQQIWAALHELGSRFDVHVTLVYCPGHVDIAGNEEADAEAKKAAAQHLSDDATPIPLGVAATALRQHVRRRRETDALGNGGAWAEACKDGAPKWSDDGMSRAEQRILAQFRAGKTPLVAEYRHLCNFTDTPTPACECGAATESVRHMVLECPIHTVARNRLFAPPVEPGLQVLARHPDRALRFL
eukprot:gene2566-4064_t